MKIIQLISEIDNESNGVANSAPNLTLELNNLVDDVNIFTFSNNTDKWNKINVEVFPIWGKKLNNSFQFSPKLYSALKNNINNTDIIHCHGTRVFPFVAPFYINRSNSNCKIIISPRGSFCDFIIEKNKKQKFISDYFLGNMRALRNADMFHATSYQEYEEIRKLGLKQPVAVISNGIILNDRIDIEKKKTLLFLSRIDRKKNIETLLKAWSIIKDDFKDWNLKIVGSGESNYFKSLTDLSIELKNERVKFLGEIKGKEKFDLMASSSLFILPSFNENFGNVIVESLSFETPVITTKGTPWEGVVENECGWWISTDLDEVVVQLKKSMSMPLDNLHTMGKKGRKWINKEFLWNFKAKQMLQAYNWITDKESDKPDFIIE